MADVEKDVGHRHGEQLILFCPTEPDGRDCERVDNCMNAPRLSAITIGAKAWRTARHDNFAKLPKHTTQEVHAQHAFLGIISEYVLLSRRYNGVDRCIS